MSEEMSERLTRIESAVAHLERLLEELNQVTIEHERRLQRLQTQQQQITASLEAKELERIKSTDSRPPHYGKP